MERTIEGTDEDERGRKVSVQIEQGEKVRFLWLAMCTVPTSFKVHAEDHNH